MDQKFLYFETGSTDCYYNLAFEEYLLTNCRTGDLLMLWQNDNTIVIGSNQNTYAEINMPYAEAHRIRVVRRTTGGGAVYHDLGNLNYSFITDLENADRVTKKRFTEPIIRALRALGVPDVTASGRNDILADGKKVSGTAQRVDHGRILHHGTLLFDSDPSKIAGALQVDPAKLRAKGIRSVQSRVGNIRPLLREDMNIEQFKNYLAAVLTGTFSEDKNPAEDPLPHPGMIPEPIPVRLSEDALRAVWELRDGKYATWEWNYGKSPEYDIVKKDRFSGGTLEIGLTLGHGRITDIRFFGDYLAVMSADELTAALRAVPFRKKEVSHILSAFPLGLIFGTISEDEILSLLFR